MKTIKILLVFLVTVLLVACLNSTTLGWGRFSPKDLDPTNKNSALRKGAKEADVTNKNSTVRKGAKELDPTNKNSALRKGAKELDPTNKNSGLRKGIKELDPFNRDSAAGKYIFDRKKVFQKEYDKQEKKINRSIRATTEKLHKNRRDLQNQGQAAYESIKRETQNSLNNLYQYTEEGMQKAVSGIQEAEQNLNRYRHENAGRFKNIDSMFEAAKNASPIHINTEVPDISIESFKKGVKKLPRDIVNSSPVKTTKQWGKKASVENISKGINNSFNRLGSSSEMKTVRRWRDEGKESVYTTGRIVDKKITRPIVDGGKAAGRYVDKNITQPLIVDPLTGMLDSEIIVYNFTTTGSFTVNLSTGAYWMRLDLPMGMVVDSTNFENWLQGNLSIPNFDPIEIATQGTIINKNNYTGFRSLYPTGTTYISSKRFVDWFSLETAANEILQAYFTAGQSAQSSLEAAKKYFVLEWNDLYSWLESQGIDYVEDVSLNIFQSIISGQSVHLDKIGISATIEMVPYTYELNVNIDSRLANILGQLGVDVSKNSQVLANSPHLAFVVKLHDLQQNQNQNQAGQEQIHRLEQVLSQGPQSLDNILQTALMDNGFPAINAMFTGRSDISNSMGDMITDVVARQTGLQDYLSQKSPFISSPMDLRGSQVSSNIRGLIGRLTFGNQGTARLSKLELDLDTLQLTCDINLTHKHSWGSLKEIQSGLADYARKTGRQFNLDRIATTLVGR